MQHAACVKFISDEREHTFSDILSSPDPVYGESTGHMLEKLMKLRKAGVQMIDGYLKEMKPYYNKTDRSAFPLRLIFDKDSKGEFKYELFYLLSISEQITVHPVQAYFEQHFAENREEKEQLGYGMMKDELSALSVGQ